MKNRSHPVRQAGSIGGRRAPPPKRHGCEPLILGTIRAAANIERAFHVARSAVRPVGMAPPVTRRRIITRGGLDSLLIIENPNRAISLRGRQTVYCRLDK